MKFPRTISRETRIDAGRFVVEHTAIARVVDPFCEQGPRTSLSVAEAIEFSTVGVARSKQRTVKLATVEE